MEKEAPEIRANRLGDFRDGWESRFLTFSGSVVTVCMKLLIRSPDFRRTVRYNFKRKSSFNNDNTVIPNHMIFFFCKKENF